VEEAVEGGIEINCAVMGYAELQASVLEQPITWQEFLTYEEKYMRGEGAAGMKERNAISRADLAGTHGAHPADGDRCVCSGRWRGMARVDFLVREANEEVFVNEINTIPGSMAFYLWQETGLTPAQVVDRLIDLALEAHADKRQTVYNYKTGLLAHAAARGLKGLKK